MESKTSRQRMTKQAKALLWIHLEARKLVPAWVSGKLTDEQVAAAQAEIAAMWRAACPWYGQSE